MTAVKRCGSGDQPPSADRLVLACRVATRVHAPSGRAAGKRLRLLRPPPLGEGWGGGRRRKNVHT